jgi:hypothetical protein
MIERHNNKQLRFIITNPILKKAAEPVKPKRLIT